MKVSSPSPLDTKTLEHFRQLLLEKRKEAAEQLNQVNRNIANLDEADDADASSMTHHMGDVGSETEEQALNYQLKERTSTYLKRIDEALQRIEKGTYGICQATGKPIGRKRLEAVPHTRYSMEAKEQRAL